MSIELAAATLFGGFLNSFGQQQANDTNRRIAAEQNAHNSKMLDKQNRFNLDMWHKQNAYNTPYAQRMRYEQAGINPALALGNITAGTAEGLTSAAAAPAAGATMQNPYAGIAEGFSSMAQLQMQSKMVEAQVRNLDAQTAGQLSRNPYAGDLAREEVRRIALQSDRDEVESEFTAYNLRRAQREEPWRLLEWQAEIEKILSETEVYKLQHRIDEFDLKHIKPYEAAALRATILSTHAYVKYLQSSAGLNSENARYIGEKVLTEVLDRHGIELDNKTKKAMLEPMVEEIKARTKISARQLQRMDHEETMDYLEFGKDVVFGTFDRVMDARSFGLRSATQKVSEFFTGKRLDNDRRRLDQRDREHNWNVRSYKDGYRGKAPYKGHRD